MPQILHSALDPAFLDIGTDASSSLTSRFPHRLLASGWPAARKRLAGQDVEFGEASTEALPLADAAFDRYAAKFVLCVSSPTD
jgi:hypothetical protein